MNKKENKNPGIPPEKLDFFQVFSYFENRGAQVKNMMFSIITWLIGFVTILLGFSIKECIELSAISVLKPIPLMAFSFIGIFIIIYAVIVIYDFGWHINRNYINLIKNLEKMFPDCFIKLVDIFRIYS